ncbi:hypothetical protein PG988_006115 [Apiospora saccharicola]
MSNTGYNSGVSKADLAYATNGYVAWVTTPFRGTTTNLQEVMRVEMKAGYLRWSGSENDNAALERVEQGSTRSEEGVDDEHTRRLNPFDDKGEYNSLPRFVDDCKLTVKHYLNQTGRSLILTSFLYNPSSGTQTVVNWILSMEAVAVATHVHDRAMAGFAELDLAKRLRGSRVWETVRATSADGKIVHPVGSPTRYVTRTCNNEELRFFVAGRRNVHRLFIQHGNTPLLKTIERALGEEREQESGRLGYLTDQPAAMMAPFIEEQIRNPGWFIIT